MAKHNDFLYQVLERFSEAIKNILHPSLYERTLREIGISLVRDVVDRAGQSRSPAQPSDQEDYLRCLAWLKTSAKWHHVAEMDATNRIRVQIPDCPFGMLAVKDPHLCQLEAGMLGGIAGQLFDYAKVEVRRGPESPAKDCCMTVHLGRTPQSVAIGGPSYPLEQHTEKESRVILAETQVFNQLSPRERQIVRLIGEGLSDKEIATALSLSVRTVEGHISRVRAKTGLGSRGALIRWAMRACDTR